MKLEISNLKSVTINELFGYTSNITNKWTDRVYANIIRDNVSEDTDP